MDVIDLKDIGKEGREEERSEENREEKDQEETSFTENTKDNYDNTRSRNNLETPTQSKTNEGLDEDDLTDLSERLQDQAIKRAVQKYDAIRALESATGVRFNTSHGKDSRELIDGISDVRNDKDDKLTAMKFKGKDVTITKKGEIDKRSVNKNKQIWEAIAAANEEYEKSFDAVANEGAGFSLSDEAVESVRESVAGSLEDLVWDKYNEISQSDSDKNIEREIRGIPYVDKNIDYDDLENPNQKVQYNAKIADLKVDIEHWKDLEEKEQDPTKKLLYKTSKELCVAKKSYMEVKAGFRPESEDALSMIEEETDANDLTRFERFKKWAKENITGVSAVAISVAGVVTAAVMAGETQRKKAQKLWDNSEKRSPTSRKKPDLR